MDLKIYMQKDLHCLYLGLMIVVKTVHHRIQHLQTQYDFVFAFLGMRGGGGGLINPITHGSTPVLIKIFWCSTEGFLRLPYES
jgi:hypothetical protein